MNHYQRGHNWGETRKYTQANPNWIPKTKPNKIGNNRWDLDFIPFVITNLFIPKTKKKPKYLDTHWERGSERDCQIYIFSLSFFLSPSKEISERRPLLSRLSLSSVSRRFDSIAVFLQRFSGIHPSSSFFRFVRSFNICVIAEYNVPDFQGMIFIIDLIIALMIHSERKAEPKKISLFFSPGSVIMSLWVCSIFSWVLNTLKFYFLLLDFRVFQMKIWDIFWRIFHGVGGVCT